MLKDAFSGDEKTWDPHIHIIKNFKLCSAFGVGNIC